MKSASPQRDNGTTLPLAFKALFRNTRQPVFLIDSNACLLTVNPAFEALFGIRCVEASGVPWREIVGYPTIDICPATATMLCGQELSGLEFQSKINGTMRRLSLTLSPLGDIGHDQPRCLGIIDDLAATFRVSQDSDDRHRFDFADAPIADPKQIIRAEPSPQNRWSKARPAAASKPGFQCLDESDSDIVMTTDLNGHVTLVSAAVQSLFGYCPSDMVGRFLTEFVPANAAAQISAMLSRVARGHIVEGLISKMCRKNGEVAIIDLNAMPVFEDSAIVGAQVIVRDVSTIQRRLELS